MIVRQFLHWIRNASALERAEATSALARAYLYSELSTDDLAAAEGAMLMLLDDPSPLVRQALSEALASAQQAPPAVVRALAADQPEVALPILMCSPALETEDLVDLMAGGEPEIQIAIAGRAPMPRPLTAAIAEVACAEACLTLLENPEAVIPAFSVKRIIERFGHLAAIRETLLANEDLPMTMRQTLLSKLSETLAGFVSGRQWLGYEHADDAAREACEKATLALAAETPYEEVGALVQHLRDTQQLTAGLILRALLSGNVVLVEEALAELSDLPIDRVIGYIHDKTVSAFHALYCKAGLPDVAYPAFREAIQAMREGALVGEHGGVSRLKRRMVERVLKACSELYDYNCNANMVPLLALLRRFAVEAAREEARAFCEDLMADRPVVAAPALDDLADDAVTLDHVPSLDEAAVATDRQEAGQGPAAVPDGVAVLPASDDIRLVPWLDELQALAKEAARARDRVSATSQHHLKPVTQDVSIALSLDELTAGGPSADEMMPEIPTSADNDQHDAPRGRPEVEERLVAA